MVVVDLSSGIPGAYCSKVLGDGGAEVVKVEAPEGDELRRWSASGAPVEAGRDGALFDYLSTSKRSAVADPSRASDLAYLEELLAGADVAVWSKGSRLSALAALHPRALAQRHPHLIVASITPFGLEGPWKDRAATEFTLQAWSGGMVGLGRGDPGRAPVFVGGRVGEWLAGAYAAVGTMLSHLRRASGADGGAVVDVSILEALAACLTYYPVTYFDALGRPFRSRRSVITPGVGVAKDGMLAVGVGTGQQWLDFCVMVGHPEWMEDPSLFRERGHLAPAIDEWFAQHTVEEIRELATAFRLPNSYIGNGANLPELDHFQARGSFTTNPSGRFVQPVPPYRLSPCELRPPAPAPALGEATGYRPRRARTAQTSGGTDVAGLRVLDMTAFWAGPSCTHVLAMLGADVIHVESAAHPDGTRMLGAPMTTERWWERSPIFSGLNTNKRSIALDLGTERGMEVLHRLIATTDVIVENYTPRVFEHLGLTFDVLKGIRDDIVLVRMPGFGLDGPWRDNAAFANTIEDASGLTHLTGYPDQKPLEPYCIGDPNAGIHALAGLLLGLAHRRRTGQGVCVEAAMVDAAINISAEQVVEYSAYGALLERDGNRGPCGAPQNLYRTGEEDERGGRDSWVAIAVADDGQWGALTEALGRPGWATAPVLTTAGGRRAHQAMIDAELGMWCGQRSADEVVALLWPAGVPVAKVMQPHRQVDLEQLEERHFFESVEHPVLGPARYATLPMRFSEGPERRHRRHAPLLGEHNEELLREVGLGEDEIAALERDGVIARAPSGSQAQARS